LTVGVTPEAIIPARAWRQQPVQIQLDIRVAAKAVFAALALFLAGCDPVAEVPVWGTLPDFSLTNQGAEPYGAAQLEGRPWIANFIFTKCPSRCPIQSCTGAVGMM
jgi:protein SCO1/2